MGYISDELVKLAVLVLNVFLLLGCDVISALFNVIPYGLSHR
jgi:hypothetical protein